jgi:hypothetical protein
MVDVGEAVEVMLAQPTGECSEPTVSRFLAEVGELLDQCVAIC